MAQKEKSAGLVVFRREKDKVLYLLLFKKYKTEYWDLPKGHIEKDEDPVETAKREAEEETGISDLKIISGFKEKLSWIYKLEGKLMSKTVTYFLAETQNSEAKISSEHLKAGWFALEEAEKVLKHKDSKELLRKAQKFIEKQEKQSLSRFI